MAQTQSPADQLSATLLNANSADLAIRTAAETQLKAMEGSNFPLYLTSLCAELGSDKKVEQSRQLAGLLLKNALFALDEQRRATLNQRWCLLHENVRKQIKAQVLQILGDALHRVRSTAAVVVATIASIEVPKKMWPELVQSLITNIAQARTPEVKQSSYEALGYVCEECPEHLQGASNMILNAIQAGMDKKETNNAIKLAATVALRNSLEFTRDNFARPEEAKLIMGMVFGACTSDNVNVRTAAYSCLVEIAGLYYQYLSPYITEAYNVTANAIKQEKEEVQLQAIEFWSTICDVESDILREHEDLKEAAAQGAAPQQGRMLYKFMVTATPQIVPLLLVGLTKQSEDVDDDTWNVAMASGTALALIAQTAKDVAVPPVLPFVHQHLVSKEWRMKEAATLAFGSILEGPSKVGLTKLVKQALPIIIQHMQDPKPIVKDTAAWTLGRICNLIPEAVEEQLPKLIQAFVLGLQDQSPKVAANVCWAIHNLAEAVNTTGESSPLSKFFQILMRTLVAATERADKDESNLMGSAYEAINVLIHTAARDVYPLVGQMIGTLLQRLKQTFLMTGLTAEEKEKQNEVQALLCGSLQVIIQKLEDKVINPHADTMMSLFLAVLNSKNASVHEEALMAISAIANKVGPEFSKYMQAFKPHLLNGLKAVQEQHVLTVAVGVVGDISRALEGRIAQVCDEIMQLLLQNLQSAAVDRSVKPHIIGAISDIALAIGGSFERYLKWVMQFLVQASQTVFQDMDQENADYLSTLRESVLEAYTGILTGMGGDNKAQLLLPYVDSIFGFLDLLNKDQDKGLDVLKAAVGVIGDLASQIGAPVAQLMAHACVRGLIQAAQDSDDAPTVKAAQWAAKSVQQLVQSTGLRASS